MKALEAIAAAIIREASGHADDVLLKAADAVISSLGSFSRGHQSATDTKTQLDAARDMIKLTESLEAQRAATLADLSKKFDSSDQ